MSEKMRVIPYTIEGIQSKAENIPYGVMMIEAPYIWNREERGDDVVVAVIDTGCQTDHPDLKERIIGGRNFTEDNNGDPNNFYDGNGHGTHVAGIIGASANVSGVVGVAPNVKLLIVKVLDANGSGNYDWIVNGIRYAMNWKGPKGEKVRVMNMSLGGPVDDPQLHQAIKDAVNQNIAVVVASGNEGDSDESTYELGYPALYNEVIEVAAADLNGKLAPFSNNNTEVDVIAPGVDILSTYIDSGYARLSGTSMATPHVSGALALLINLGEKEFNRTLTEAEIYALLVKHTVSLNYKKSSEGHGLVKLAYMEKVRDLLNYIESNF